MSKEKPDLSKIVPAAGTVEIDGVSYRVKRLRLLELASLVRVVTTGAGPALASIGPEMMQEDDWGPQMMGLLVVALPNAVEEFVAFLNTILEREDGKSDTGIVNPDLDVVLDVVNVMVEQEKDEIPALMGKARVLWEAQIKPLIPTGSDN